ncbi:MAG: asparagine synthase (glutamine-hydrolyzing), partial [Acidobacteria bacterium]|nr:asparagine synthase (glutamine-hydrolyzing) [Acidobacteriota bacterium]
PVRPARRTILGLGHRRLKVVDLTEAAAQPMRDPLGRGWLVYNGELYNAHHLRRELEAGGVRFRSRSDTEVVLQALIAWGADALPRFNGMFALAFWRPSARSLLLARDRFGEKPLYYARLPGALVFGSEIGALAHHGGLPLELDPQALELYLTFGFVPAPWTIYRAVRKIPQASFLEAAPGRPGTVQRYYRLEDCLEQAPPARPREALREALREAVRRRLEADVPLGAFLSGGVDSSAVVALMAGLLCAPPRTYSMAVPGLAYFDESNRARETARALGTAHREVTVGAARLQEEIPPVLDALDEPFADSSALAASIISREARRELTVALSGDGGDEVFGGYRLYRALAAHHLLRRLPGAARAALELLLAPLHSRHGGGAAGAVRRARKLLDGLSSDLATAHAAWMSICGGAERRALRPAAADEGLGRALIEDRYRRFGGGLQRTLAVEIDLPLPDDMLAKVDRMSMRQSLEVRAPFLDPDLVRLALSLPVGEHFSPLAGKRLLRRALRGLVPRAVLAGPKRGFEVPVGHWIAGPLAPLYSEVVSARTLREALGIDPRVAGRWFDEHRARRADRGAALWALFAVCWWQDGPRRAHVAAAGAAQSRALSRSAVTVLRRSEG